MVSAAVHAYQRASGGVFGGTACVFSFGAGITATETIAAEGVNNGRATLRLYGETLAASG
jgi:hypothetical protein